VAPAPPSGERQGQDGRPRVQAGPQGQLHRPEDRGSRADLGRRDRCPRDGCGQGLKLAEPGAHGGPGKIRQPREEDGQVHGEHRGQQGAPEREGCPGRPATAADVSSQAGRGVGGQRPAPQHQPVGGMGRHQLSPGQRCGGDPSDAGGPAGSSEGSGSRRQEQRRPGQGPGEGQVRGEERSGHRQRQAHAPHGRGGPGQSLAAEEPVRSEPSEERLGEHEPPDREMAGEDGVQGHGREIEPPRLGIGGERGSSQREGVPCRDPSGGQARPQEAVVGEPESQQVGVLIRDHALERDVVEDQQDRSDDQGRPGHLRQRRSAAGSLRRGFRRRMGPVHPADRHRPET